MRVLSLAHLDGAGGPSRRLLPGAPGRVKVTVSRPRRTDLLQAVGDALFRPVQAVLVGGLGAQGQHAQVGTQGASTQPKLIVTVVGPFNVRLQLRVRPPHCC